MQFGNLFDSRMPMFNIILPLFSGKPSDVDVILGKQVIHGPHSKSYMPMHFLNQKMSMYIRVVYLLLFLSLHLHLFATTTTNVTKG